METNAKINVAIIEDQQELREMLGQLLEGSDGFVCAAKFENAEEALKILPSLKPDVVLVDIHLPGQSGIAAVKILKEKCEDAKFLMCTSLEDTDNIFNALKAGADGYISKTLLPVKILEAITDVYKGGAPMSSQIARKVVAFFQTEAPKKINAELEKLSNREQEILQYLSKGYRYKEISGFLFISIETVRKHIHNIYEKLQVSSRTDALNKVADY
ncbi:response regulator [Pedobacter cryophilus]|uniref:Response regulator transcription factor n=1 Tax=Pedobacter cryophilus TaxID=2571271 RepID=A0A4U1C1J8_9SPHI|nr:response regulator transcription factor [Pedobacter cryophilus]TKB96937.1 response regulator transcription factor [Pedobacter cryophilus]